MVQSLIRHVIGAPRWLQLTTSGISLLAVASAVVWWVTHESMSCEKHIKNGEWQRAVATCLASYEGTGNVRDGTWAASAYLQLDELKRAGELARRFVAGPLYGDAHAVLGYIAMRHGSTRAARLHGAIALVAHTLTGDARGAARDEVLLSQIAWKLGDFTAALAAAEQALWTAGRLGDARLEVRAHLARADALRRMGDTRGAAATLSVASARATDPCERAWILLKKAMCQMESRHDGLAMLDLATAQQANLRCRNEAISTSIAINQAWLLRRQDPAAALARLTDLPEAEQDDVEVLLLRGYLAADRGALGEAEHYLTQAASRDALDADWPWVVARARAELSELRGGLAGERIAEEHYRRATAMISALRTTARARSAYLVSSHRGPYDGLIALLARNRRWRDVLAVVLELDASDMLRATAADVMARDPALLDAETPAPRSTTMPTSTIEDVVSAWRPRDLVIVIAASGRKIGAGEERVYRLRISDGRIAGEDVGDANAARTQADRLFLDADDRDAARALGRMMVPSDRATGTLHVLAIGSLAKVPLAALRDEDGSLSIARRPLVRVLALRANGAEGTGAGPPVVIADPQGDLPTAATEGSLVAEVLGPGTEVAGAGRATPATRDRLWMARDAALLHIAGHVGVHGRWRALQLADGTVDPAEIVQRRFAPRIAVLAGCGSAAATDEEGWGSIAAALLESGTTVVVATDRSIGDAATLPVIRDFYTQPDWRTDPARALARVQQAIAARPPAAGSAPAARIWAAFSVLVRPPEVPERSVTDTLR
jgi:tetratricopeptide (TPR) repeat protein